MIRKNFLLIPALLLVPFVLAACGNDDDTNDIDFTPTADDAPANGFDDQPTNGVDDQPANGLDDDPVGGVDDQPVNGQDPADMEGLSVDDYDFDSAEQTENGVRYIDETVGDGAEAQADSQVQFHYQGTLEDGTIFDSSYLFGQPVEFPLNQVIDGFAEGIQGMQEGGKRILLIPADLAYGPDGIEQEGIVIVPPDADLIFEIELIQVTG